MEKEIVLSKKDVEKGIILPKTISSELAYLSGVLIGDGSIGFRDNKKEYVVCCFGNPLDEQEFYFQVVGPKFKQVFNFMPKMKSFHKNTTFGFRIYSKTLFLFFTKFVGLPVGIKYGSLKLPEIFKENKSLVIPLIRGIFDTDGCISFKKRNKLKPYYPVISLASKSKTLIFEVSTILKKLGFRVVEKYDYKVRDSRFKIGFSIINTLTLNGESQLKLWNEKVGFANPKHLNKIKKVAGEGFEPSTFTRAFIT